MNELLKLGSLFDGSGGFPLAGVMTGVTPVWASEIEPYPIAVTKSRFPEMKHVGSVTDICGRDLEPVDIITFGSPCQDMSISGKRAGLKHSDKGDVVTTQSGLFYEAIRIIKEMREVTDGKYPIYAVWENVPNAFYNNQGQDFQRVLEEIAGIRSKSISIPRPAAGKRWSRAGEIMGDDWSIAWRTLDAQYWGVPQRRKRIYLVADFTGKRAGKILFECKGLHGNTAQSRTAREGTAQTTGESIERNGCDSCLSAVRKASDIASVLNDVTVYEQQRLGVYKSSGLCSTQRARQYKDADDLVVQKGTPPQEYNVRRLTPLECCRLQGFPDGYSTPIHIERISAEDSLFWENVRKTHATATGKKYTPCKSIESLTKWYNNLHTDSSEYKMWGNGIALPCAAFVLKRIAEVAHLSEVEE